MNEVGVFLGHLIMPPGCLPEVFQALVRDPGAEPKHTGIMYLFSLEMPQDPLGASGGCNLNKGHLLN